MRIAVIGAHGVGKTTLSKLLSKNLNIPVINDVVVEAYKKGFVINEQTPMETQFWLFSRQLEEEKNTPHFVADKCLMDYSVYADIIFDDERIKSLLREMTKNNISYDHIFYLPVEFAIEDDGVRSTNIEFQTAIDSRYRNLIDEWGIKYTVLTGSIENRLAAVLNLI